MTNEKIIEGFAERHGLTGRLEWVETDQTAAASFNLRAGIDLARRA